MIRYLIWDFDGSLFDTYPAINRAIVAALDDLRVIESIERVEALTRESIGRCMTAMADEYDVDKDALLKRFRLRYQAMSPETQPPFPGALTVCELVNEMSGKNVIVTHRRRASVEQFLDVHQMASLFVDCIAGDDDYPRKPDPGSFEAVMERNDFVRGETLAIGDRALDVQAGQAAGVQTCLVGTPLDSVKPDVLLENRDFAQLHRLIVGEISNGALA